MLVMLFSFDVIVDVSCAGLYIYWPAGFTHSCIGTYITATVNYNQYKIIIVIIINTREEHAQEW